MRRYCCAAAVIVFGGTAWAQEHPPTPVGEVGANYSFNHFVPGNGAPDFTSQGGSAFFEYNLNRVVGLVSDFGVYRNGSAEALDSRTFTYLFGPRFNLRLSRFTPFFQTLVGGARLTSDLVPTANGSTFQQNSFAMSVGGGLDIALTHHFSIKPFEVDYLMTQLPNVWSGNSLENNVQNNLRYSAGVVFRFGEK
jgi:opacity protein-like surface antigen